MFSVVIVNLIDVVMLLVWLLWGGMMLLVLW